MELLHGHDSQVHTSSLVLQLFTWCPNGAIVCYLRITRHYIIDHHFSVCAWGRAVVNTTQAILFASVFDSVFIMYHNVIGKIAIITWPNITLETVNLKMVYHHSNTLLRIINSLIFKPYINKCFGADKRLLMRINIYQWKQNKNI